MFFGFNFIDDFIKRDKTFFLRLEIRTGLLNRFFDHNKCSICYRTAWIYSIYIVRLRSLIVWRTLDNLNLDRTSFNIIDGAWMHGRSADTREFCKCGFASVNFELLSSGTVSGTSEFENGVDFGGSKRLESLFTWTGHLTLQHGFEVFVFWTYDSPYFGTGYKSFKKFILWVLKNHNVGSNSHKFVHQILGIHVFL